MDGHGWFKARIVWMMGKMGIVCAYDLVNEKGKEGMNGVYRFWNELVYCVLVWLVSQVLRV